MLSAIERLARAPGFMSVSTVTALALVVAGGYWATNAPARSTHTYCAMLPDTVGLYTGNAVTLRGIRVGTVSSIRNENSQVRVEFTVASAHPLRGTVSATTVANTLVADRNLAVINGGSGDQPIASAECITSTLTPKSLTETLSALKTLAAELGADPAGTPEMPLADGIKALDRATAGTGPEINTIIAKLSAALSSPDAAIGRIGTILQSLSALARSIANGWDDIKSMLTRFSTALDQANNELLSQAADVVDDLRVIVPWVNSITRAFGGPILKTIDAAAPLLHSIGSQTGTMEDILRRTPILVDAFERSVNPESQRIDFAVRSPSVIFPDQSAAQICALVNTTAPDACATTDGSAKLNIARLLNNVAAGGPR